ncbi:ferrous iron transport protein A [Polycladidibacter stylochi]|uniref:ferrous iron transport protein A n=1 Tax=Polycladidibacter stylochi TaxID=1807766 RepID=UPI000835DE5D|nr:ferrous iron transport protein A [Pseudovibrio stylochi]
MSEPVVESFDQPIHVSVFQPFKDGFEFPKGTQSLLDARRHTPLRVVRLGGTQAESLKLRALGLSETREIVILEGISSRPRVIACGAVRVALSAKIANNILVQEVN